MYMRQMQKFILLQTFLLTTVSANSISITPDSLYESLDFGDTAIHTVTITNNYPTEIDVTLSMVEQAMFPPRQLSFFDNENNLDNQSTIEIEKPDFQCGTPDPDPNEWQLTIDQVQQWVANQNRSNRNIVNVLIAWHVIYSSNGVGYLTDNQIYQQVEWLNDAFADHEFYFTLEVIDHTVNNDWFNDMYDTYDAEAKQSLYLDPYHHMNVYSASLWQDGVGGYAYLPNSWPQGSYMHGIVIDYRSLPYYDNTSGDTGVHEAGHYLGLHHTFYNNCSVSNDGVDDTPAHHEDYNDICNANLDSCPNQPGNDPVHNYMNYTNDACTTEYSPGQKDRMHAMVAQYRPSLLDNPVAPAWLTTSTLELAVPANSSIAADFTFDATNTYGGNYYTAINYSSVAADTTIEGYATLQVMGDPQITSNTSSISFGGVYVNDTTSMQLFLSNTGTDDLVISSIVSDPDVFFTTPSAGAIDPEESMNVTVYFLPTVVEYYAGSVTISSNDEDDSVFVIPVYGQGLVSPMQFSMTAISDTMAPNDLHIHRIALTNSGNFTLNYNISHDIPWVTLSHSEGQLDAGAEDSVSVTIFTLFMGYGDYEGTLMFTTNVGEFILPVHLVITVLGVDDNAVIPSVFSVSENYPNPFNPRTQFTVSLPKMSHVVVTIYDILGRQVALLAEGDYNAGRYKMEWDGMMDMNAAAPSGVYLLVVQAGDHVFKHKMIMMK